jgi:hypothetical protein
MIQFAFIIYIFCISGFFAKTFLSSNFFVGSLFLPMIIGLILALFAELQLLQLGVYLSYGLIAIVTFLFLRSFVKNEVILGLGDSSFLLFVVLSVIIYFICKNNTPVTSEELTNWGLIPRALHFKYFLNFDKGFLINASNYAKTPLSFYLFLCTVISSTYSHASVYVGYYVLCLAISLSMVVSETKRNKKIFFTKIVIGFVFLLSFYYPNGGTEFRILMDIDFNFMKALMFGFLFNLVLKKELRKVDIFSLSLSLLWFCLLDIQSYFMSVFVILTYVYRRSYTKEIEVESKYANFIFLAVMILGIITNISEFQIILDNIPQYFNILEIIFGTPFLIANIIPLGIYLFIFFPVFVFSMIKGLVNNAFHKRVLLFQIACFFVYCCLLSAFVDGKYVSESYTLQRQINAYVAGILISWIPFITLETKEARAKDMLFQLQNICLMILVIVTIMCSEYDVIRQKFFNWEHYSNTVYSVDYNIHKEDAEYHIEKIASTLEIEEPVNLYFSMGGCDFSMSYMHELVQYRLLEHQIHVVNNPMTLDCISVEQAIIELEKAEFLYLAYPVSEEFNEELNLFYNIDIMIEAEKVYQLIREENQVKFVDVSE